MAEHALEEVLHEAEEFKNDWEQTKVVDQMKVVTDELILSHIEKEAEAEHIEAKRIEAERIEAERIEAKRIEAEHIEAKRIEAKRIEAERKQTLAKPKMLERKSMNTITYPVVSKRRQMVLI